MKAKAWSGREGLTPKGCKRGNNPPPSPCQCHGYLSSALHSM